MRKTFGLVVAAVLALAAPAEATPYSQAINESGVGAFDRIEAFVASPSSGVAMSAFSDGSWSNATMGPLWSVATGNALSSLTYNISFDYGAIPFTYDFFAFNGDTLLDSARFTYNNGLSWVDPIADQVNVYLSDVANARSAVPEPITLALMGTGLIGLGFMVRRKSGGAMMATPA